MPRFVQLLVEGFPDGTIGSVRPYEDRAPDSRPVRECDSDTGAVLLKGLEALPHVDLVFRDLGAEELVEPGPGDAVVGVSCSVENENNKEVC